MSSKFTEDDDALFAELGIDISPQQNTSDIPGESRVDEGVSDIQKFETEHGRIPDEMTTENMSEQLLAIRRKKIDKENKAVLPDSAELSSDDEWIKNLDDDELLAELGVDDSSITNLKFVRSAKQRKDAERESPDYVAKRRQCHEFDRFKPLFEKIRREIKTEVRATRLFKGNPQIEKGRYFILNGQIAYVAEKEKPFINKHQKKDARLRVIYDNGTENDLLMHSFQNALGKDIAGRRITEPNVESLPIFSEQEKENNTGTSGRIYVLSSTANIPYIAEHRKLVHKIGVTGGSVERRIANAKNEPTFLMADVNIVREYPLQYIDRVKLENMIHRIFESAQLDIEISNQFGKSIQPREWFLAPLHIIDETIDRIRQAFETGGKIDFTYDPTTGELQNNNIDDSPEPG